MFVQQKHVCINLNSLDYYEIRGNDISFHFSNGKMLDFVFESRTEAEIVSKKIANAMAIGKQFFRCD